jgi:PTH1 family peptidyl-tRNA hydrolase
MCASSVLDQNNMKAIVGLGNPGTKYEQTRHNIVFLTLDALASRFNAEFRNKTSAEAELTEIMVGEERVLLVKPQTFMNASGRSVAHILSHYPVKMDDVLVVYDDADLAFGDVRYRQGGSSAGQKGIQSIIDLLPSGAQVQRVRMGIGRPHHPDIPLDQFVLGRWSDREDAELPQMISDALEIVTNFILDPSSL